MAFWKALGFGVLLVILRVFMPEVFDAIKDFLLQVFGLLGDILALGKDTLRAAPGILLLPNVAGLSPL